MAPQRLDQDGLLRGVNDLCKIDAALAEVVTRHGAPPMWGRRPGFATLIRMILEQQVSLASGRAVYRRINAELGGVNISAVLEAGASRLRGLGVTRQKAGYCLEVAAAVESGRLNFRRLSRAADDCARDELTAVKGIGPWTADVYLLMALRRPDIWPPGDIALLTALQHLRGWDERPTSDHAILESQRWRPWRAVVARRYRPKIPRGPPERSNATHQ